MSGPPPLASNNASGNNVGLNSDSGGIGGGVGTAVVTSNVNSIGGGMMAGLGLVNSIATRNRSLKIINT